MIQIYKYLDNLLIPQTNFLKLVSEKFAQQIHTEHHFKKKIMRFVFL